MVVLGLVAVQAWGQWTELTGMDIRNVDRGNFAVADIDGDGDMDIIFSGINPDVSGEENGAVWINDGQGRFTEQTGERVVKMGRSGNIDFGDINGDGHLDILFGGWGIAVADRGIALGDGEGHFTLADKAQYPMTDMEKLTSCGFADFNRDGLLDYYAFADIGREGTAGAIIYFQQADGSFQANATCIPHSQYMLNEPCAEVIDFNRDGAPDIWIDAGDESKSCEELQESMRVSLLFLNNGDGTFREVNPLGMGLLYAKCNGSTTWADVDGDGYLDLLHNGDGYLCTGEDNDQVWRLYRNVNGTGLQVGFDFDMQDVGRQSSLHNGGYIVDWDGDGTLDLVTAGWSTSLNNQRLDWWKGDANNRMGAFTMQSFGEGVPGFSEQGLRIADLDGDGKPDLLACGYTNIGNGGEAGRAVGWVRNTSASRAAVPGAPKAVFAENAGGVIKFTWQAPAGFEGVPGITYNLSLRNITTGKWFYHPLADLSTGKRTVAGRMGNVFTNTEYRLSNLPVGIYEWQVQAINGQYMGGAFSEPQTFMAGDMDGHSGWAGVNLRWQLTEDSVLTISGEGMLLGSKAWFAYEEKVKHVILEEGVAGIGDWAFYEWPNLLSITIPESVTSIGNEVFAGCEKLASVKIPAALLGGVEFSSLRTLIVNSGTLDEEAGAFIRSNAETLETIDLSACNNATLPDEALAGCYHVKNILLPASLTQTGYGAFKECTALASVTLPAALAEVGDRAFEDCRSLTAIQFASEGALTRIGNWAFYNCHQLQTLQLPEGVEEVGLAAFYGCSYLEDIELPSTLRSIGDHAFAHNTKARKMTVHAAVPPVVEAKTFLRVSRDMPVYVPAESLASYQAAAYWQDLNLQPIGDATGMGHLSLSESITVVNGEVHINMTGTGEVQVYDLQGRSVLRTTESRFALPQGIYIIKVGDEALKVAI